MKKIIISLLLAFIPTLFFAQNVFDKFDGPDEVTAVVVSKKMFEMMGNVKTNDKDAQQFLSLVKTLDNLKVFTTSDTKYRADMRATINSYLSSKALEELMRVSDSSSNVKIYVNSGGSATQIKELLMFIDGKSDKETIIVSLTGNFDLNNISALVDKMNLPGGEQLKKASKK